MDIKKKVGQLVKTYGNNNPFEIAKSLGIEVRIVPLGKILGFHSRQFRISIIHINESAPHEKQLFTCAHELGHAVLHPGKNTSFMKSNTFFSTDRLETEANSFAIELLFLQKGSASISLRDATNIYGIPKQILDIFLRTKRTNVPN